MVEGQVVGRCGGVGIPNLGPIFISPLAKNGFHIFKGLFKK